MSIYMEKNKASMKKSPDGLSQPNQAQTIKIICKYFIRFGNNSIKKKHNGLKQSKKLKIIHPPRRH